MSPLVSRKSTSLAETLHVLCGAAIVSLGEVVLDRLVRRDVLLLWMRPSVPWGELVVAAMPAVAAMQAVAPMPVVAAMPAVAPPEGLRRVAVASPPAAGANQAADMCTRVYNRSHLRDSAM